MRCFEERRVHHETYRLRELLELLKLTKIPLELCPMFDGKSVGGCVAEIRRDAGLLIRMFADRNRRVEVLVVDFGGRSGT